MIRHALVAGTLLALPLSLAAADWQAADGARLAFKGSYQGDTFEGVFERFEPDIRFDAGDLDSAAFEVEIDLASASTGVSDYDSAMREPEFFNTRRFPTARFTAGAFRAIGEGGYEADAELTIRDKTRALAFPFRFERDGDRARLTATVTINRLDYDIGTGDWSDTSLLADAVEVSVDLPLTAKP